MSDQGRQLAGWSWLDTSVLLFINMEPQQNEVESVIAPLSKVTVLSKVTAAIVFITLPFVGFLVGMQYSNLLSDASSYVNPSSGYNPTFKTQYIQEPLPATSTVAFGHILALSSTTVTIDFLEPKSQAAYREYEELCRRDTTFGETSLCLVFYGDKNLLTDPTVYTLDASSTLLEDFREIKTPFGDFADISTVQADGLIEGYLYKFIINPSGVVETITPQHRP